MRALVLGGSQFIGLHLVRLLCSEGHSVTVLNRAQTPAELPEGVERLRADRNDGSQVRAALQDRFFDAAFDISGYTPAQLEPVVEALNGGVGRYVFCSSTAVYAPSDVAPILEDFPLNRSSEPSRYARDKIACEELLMEAYGRRGFPATIIRPPTVYGPDNSIAERESSFFARLTRRRKVILPGDGSAMFHAVHVDDLADAFVRAAGRSPALGQAYTGCGEEPISANDFVKAIGKAMGVTSEIVHVEPKRYQALTGELAVSEGRRICPSEWMGNAVYSNEKARRDLGWSPRYGMREGLAMTYRWWLEEGLDKQPWDFSHEDRALELIASGSAR